MSRTDTRLSRRAMLSAFLGSLFGARFTSLAETEIDWLFRWCSFDRPRFAGAP